MRMTSGLSVPARLPGGLPLIGHGLQFGRDPLGFVCQRGLGDVVSFRLGRELAYLVTTPEATRDLLIGHSQQTQNGKLFQRLKVLGGDGLGSISGAPHRRRRQMMTPLFTHDRLSTYSRMMSEVAAAKCATWHDGQQLALDKELHEISSTIVVRSLFSSDLGVKAAGEAAALLPVVFAGVAKRAYAPTGLMFALPTSANRQFNAATQRLHAIVSDIIAAYRAEGTESVERSDMLSMLLAARDPETGERLTEAQVHDEVMTAFFVGTEASAAALAWIFYLLDRHPNVATRVTDEVDEVLAGRPAQADDVPKLAYLRRAAHEALRMYPPGWLFPRIPTEPITLAGYRVEAGANVFFSPYALHHDPRLFPEPERFDPDRWLDERPHEIPRDAYIPFGEGVRVCVGGSYAMSELLIVVATLLGHWQFTGLNRDDVVPAAATTLRPSQLPMVVNRR